MLLEDTVKRVILMQIYVVLVLLTKIVVHVIRMYMNN